MTTEHKLLNDAADEIVRLRKELREKTIRLEMVDKMLFLVEAQGPRSGGGIMSASNDIVREINDHLVDNIDELSASVKDAILLRKGKRA